MSKFKTQPASKREARPVLLHRVRIQERQHLMQALERPLSCVFHKGFQVGREETYRTPMTEAKGEQKTLFLWFNYCRWRLMVEVRNLEGRPLTLAAANQIIKWRRTAEEIREVLITSNKGLAFRAAQRVANHNDDDEDMEQEALSALMASVDRYDAGNGTRFGSYCFIAILRRLWLQGKRSKRYTDNLDSRSQGALEEYTSHETENVDQNALDLQEFMSGDNRVLTDLETRVLKLRHGMHGGRAHTLRGAGRALSMSHQAVADIEQDAIDKLREAFGV